MFSGKPSFGGDAAGANEESSQSSSAPYRKKKKLSLLRQAKNHRKSGRFGRGKPVEQDTYDYFVSVLAQMGQDAERRKKKSRGLDDDDEDDDNDAAFVANVFKETEGQELSLCQNQLVCRVLEQLLPRADTAVWRRFMSRLGQDVRIAATDPFASHVMEKLLNCATFLPRRVAEDQQQENDDDNEDDDATFFRLWVLKISRFVVNNMDDFVFDTYASHLLRTCFQCLSGRRLSEDLLRSRSSRGQDAGGGFAAKKEDGVDRVEVTSEHLAVLADAVRRIKEFPDQMEIVGSNTSSGVIQALILATAEALPKECEKLCSQLVEKSFSSGKAEKKEKEEGEDKAEEEELPLNLDLFDCEPACRIFEAVLSLSKQMPAVYDRAYELYFSGRLAKLSLHHGANFVVQKLLNHCHHKEKFEKWYDTYFDNSLEDLLASGNPGVVLSLAQACRRLGANSKQGRFLVALMKAFHCYEPSVQQTKLAPLLFRMQTREAFEESTDKVMSVHNNGCRILNELLQFSKPIKLVSSLLAMDGAQLRQLMSDPKGSHVTDAFMNSQTIGEKSKEGLVKALNGELFSLSCSKHGSRSMDSLWSKSCWRARSLIAGELSKSEPDLKRNDFGKFVAMKCYLSAFRRSKDEWQKSIEVKEKAKDMMEDIFGDEKKAKKEKKKSEKVEQKEEEKPKKRKAEEVEEREEKSEESDETKKKKKKKKAKSYLDDL